jgi:uridylate kinase
VPRQKSEQTNINVLKLSGSIFFSEGFREIVESITGVLDRMKKLRLVVICGGGSTARRYIEAGSRLGVDKASLDEIGIQISRLNARIFSLALGDLAFEQIPTSIPEVAELVTLSSIRGKRVVSMGGLHPGQSTNAVAALVAEKVRATKFFNLTDVEGVYDKDPRKFRDAKLLRTVTVEQLEGILRNEAMLPGGYDLMDPVALRLIRRSRINTIILKCGGKELERALSGRYDFGTRIVFKRA